jgi:hypothetical protein
MRAVRKSVLSHISKAERMQVRELALGGCSVLDLWV